MVEKVVNLFVDVVIEIFFKDEKVVVMGFGIFEVCNCVVCCGKNLCIGEEIIVLV